MKDLILQNELYFVALKLFGVIGVVATLLVGLVMVMEFLVAKK